MHTFRPGMICFSGSLSSVSDVQKSAHSEFFRRTAPPFCCGISPGAGDRDLDSSAWLAARHARLVGWCPLGDFSLLDAMSREEGWAVAGWAGRALSTLAGATRRAAPCGSLGIAAWSEPVAICGGLRDCRARLPKYCDCTFALGSSDQFAVWRFDTPKNFGKKPSNPPKLTPLKIPLTSAIRSACCCCADGIC